jgi:hypothetical protein
MGKHASPQDNYRRRRRYTAIVLAFTCFLLFANRERAHRLLDVADPSPPSRHRGSQPGRSWKVWRPNPPHVWYNRMYGPQRQSSDEQFRQYLRVTPSVIVVIHSFRICLTRVVPTSLEPSWTYFTSVCEFTSIRSRNIFVRTHYSPAKRFVSLWNDWVPVVRRSESRQILESPLRPCPNTSIGSWSSSTSTLGIFSLPLLCALASSHLSSLHHTHAVRP